MLDRAQYMEFSLGKPGDFPHDGVGGEKLGLKLNSAQLGLDAWVDHYNIEPKIV